MNLELRAAHVSSVHAALQKQIRRQIIKKKLVPYRPDSPKDLRCQQTILRSRRRIAWKENP
ncbi:unnamed protein product [Thlaspi arvense]|uniref:Uncharacterized protein n=1 Tax=Thlaspi arvense TaxID=13288 RepID=A0AAU9RTC2_THLAR|nr:unnamed protein product [Thlaspi arvense]